MKEDVTGSVKCVMLRYKLCDFFSSEMLELFNSSFYYLSISGSTGEVMFFRIKISNNERFFVGPSKRLSI